MVNNPFIRPSFLGEGVGIFRGGPLAFSIIVDALDLGKGATRCSRR